MTTVTKMTVNEDAVNALRASVRGEVVTHQEPSYDGARAVWNGSIDRRPVMGVRCRGVADVRAALRFGREHDLEIAVRGGGHNVAGFGTCDGGIVIDLRSMTGARVYPQARVV